MGQTIRKRRVKYDRYPVLRDDQAVFNRKTLWVCIQLLEDKIQNMEIQVPTATIKVEKKCARGQPDSSQRA